MVKKMLLRHISNTIFQKDTESNKWNSWALTLTKTLYCTQLSGNFWRGQVNGQENVTWAHIQYNFSQGYRIKQMKLMGFNPYKNTMPNILAIGRRYSLLTIHYPT